jgi:hypothetical protein
MSTIVCIVHTLAGILGNGKPVLVKHLFLFDILFDIVAAAILNRVLMFYLKLTETKSSKSNFQGLTVKVAPLQGGI